MKIEKLNDNQIRCILTKEDFESRQLNLNELAYGSDKAKTLFREMMSKAYQEFGFNVENIPLMVEAIPMAEEGITLIITKVNDPEELDTRFSRFSSKDKENPKNTLESILDLYQKYLPTESPTLETTKESPEVQDTTTPTQHQVSIYEFDDMESLVTISKIIFPLFGGESQLFFEQESNKFFLLLSVPSDLKDFYKIGNLLSDYSCLSSTPKEMAYIYEYAQKIIPSNALYELSMI